MMGDSRYIPPLLLSLLHLRLPFFFFLFVVEYKHGMWSCFFKLLLRVWYMQFKSWFCIQIQKIAGPTLKKLIWYMRFKWGLKSQLEFYVGSMPNLSLAFHLFFNSSRIQIWTQFFCGSNLLPLLAHFFLIFPFSLSLSPPDFSTSLSCSRPF